MCRIPSVKSTVLGLEIHALRQSSEPLFEEAEAQVHRLSNKEGEGGIETSASLDSDSRGSLDIDLLIALPKDSSDLTESILYVQIARLPMLRNVEWRDPGGQILIHHPPISILFASLLFTFAFNLCLFPINTLS